MNQYKHVNQSERELIFLYISQGKSYRDIGKLIGRDHRSVGREVIRNHTTDASIYSPSIAHTFVSNRRKIATLGKLSDPALRSFIIKELSIFWSLEQIAGRLNRNAPNKIISAEAIYQFIYTLKTRNTFAGFS